MNQSRLESFVEAALQTAIGLALNIALSPVIYPLFGMHTTIRNYLGVSVAFTFVSVLRGYGVRRFFNAGLHRASVAIARTLLRRRP